MKSSIGDAAAAVAAAAGEARMEMARPALPLEADTAAEARHSTFGDSAATGMAARHKGVAGHVQRAMRLTLESLIAAYGMKSGGMGATSG